jgi:hypothetical protein
LNNLKKIQSFNNQGAILIGTLRSEIEAYTGLLIFKEIFHPLLLFEPARLLIFKKISSCPVFQLRK